MANGKPLIFTEIEVVAAGGASGSGNTYTLPDTENITINVEETTTNVEENQAILDYLDEGFDVRLYDLDVKSDSNVQDDSTIVDPAKVFLKGASGGETLSIDNVRLRAIDNFEGNRKGVQLICNIRSTSSAIVSS